MGIWTSFFSQVDTSHLPKAGQDFGEVQRALSLVFAITGGISVLIITIAGLRYINSRGNPQAVEQSKNAIIYAVVGLVVSMAAFGIVAFVLKST